MNVIPINDQTWIICGGRDFANQEMFNAAMEHLTVKRGMPRCVVNGGARGADMMARHWGERHALIVKTEEAKWLEFGKAAGPIRNQVMLDKYSPDLIVAFPGGPGTADMVKRGRAADVQIAEVTWEPINAG